VLSSLNIPLCNAVGLCALALSHPHHATGPRHPGAAQLPFSRCLSAC